MSTPLEIGMVALLTVSLLVVLATGTVVARLAVHMRDEAWSRISVEQRRLRHRERELADTGVCICSRVEGTDRSDIERTVRG